MAGLHERDELNEPLGMAPPPRKQPLSYGRLALAGLAALAVGGAIYLVETGDRFGGEPYAIASVEIHSVVPPTPPAAAPIAAAASATGPVEPSSAGQVEATTGVKVVRAGNAPPPGSLIIQVPDALGLHLLPAPDKRLVDKSKISGCCPASAPMARVRPTSTRGRRWWRAGWRWARQESRYWSEDSTSEAGTMDAIAKLPGAVSLGFAPYGADVERDVAQAREAGHEALLQLPMEPFDYPANNPGPHTLLTSLSEAENLDNLHWLMSRFTGYVGVANFLGAKFTADPAALTPVLSDIATRGLLYLDDGTSPRSLAREKAGAVNLRAGVADVVLDANPTPQAIEAALLKLEALARANGAAIGMASALPGNVERISRWADSLEARGVALTPLSALVSSRLSGPAAQANP